MFLRRLMVLTLTFSTIVNATSVASANLPPETRKELADLMKELKDVGGFVKKKEVDKAKELIKKAEDRVKELAIPEDEKDRTFASFKSSLEKAKNLIPVSFEHEVAPILRENCTRCHGADQAGGMLRLDTFNGIAKGGRNGVPVAPKIPARSALVLRMASDVEQQRMPKGGAKLPQDQIMIVARWIEQGANFDGTDRDALIDDSAVEKKPPVEVVMADGSETVSFKDDVAPWLVNICMGCHSGNNPRGKFRIYNFRNSCCRAGQPATRSCPASRMKATSSIWCCVRIL